MKAVKSLIIALGLVIGMPAFANPDPDPNLAVVETIDQQESLVRGSDIVDYARNFLGRPYRSGSKGPKAFDCSGFTSYVFKNFNLKLGASSRDQYRQGVGVEKSELQPGDLLFFSGSRNSANVGHVGIVTDVNEDGSVRFIHAASSGGIRYDNYPDGGYYSKRYIGAKRVH